MRNGGNKKFLGCFNNIESEKNLLDIQNLAGFFVKRTVQHRWRGALGIPTLARGNEISFLAISIS
jgi:hypothetical protein